MPVKKGGQLIRGNDAARFASKTVSVGECTEWTGARNENGYGKFMVGRFGSQRTWIAHRYAYAQNNNGAEPIVVRHKCDNPRCVRPEHLEGGTQLDNVHDAMERGRRPSVLSVDAVRWLRDVYDAGGSLRAAARSLAVNYYTAYQAATRKTWRHVT